MRFFSNSTPVTENEIREAETLFGIQLPESLKTMILNHNGATWSTESNLVDSLISFSRNDPVSIFNSCILPEGYMPFADDGKEGCYALSAKEGEGVVHFSSPDNGLEKICVCDSFDTFLSMLSQQQR